MSPVWLVNIFLGAAALATYLAGVRNLPALSGPVLHIPWPLLAVAFCAAEIGVVHLRFRAEAHSISANELPLVVGLFFVSPDQLILAQVLGAGVALILHRRQPLVKLAFNLANLALQTGVAVLIFHGLVGRTNPFGPMGWLAALVATIACAAIALGAIIGAIVLSQSRVQPGQAAQTFAFGLAATFTTTNLAIIAANAIASHVYLTAPMLVLSVVLVAAYRAYGAERSRRDSLEFLYRASQVTQSSGDLETVFVELLEHTRAMFQADVAEIVLLDSEDQNEILRTTVGYSDRPEVMVNTESPLTRAAIVAAAERPGAIIDRRSRHTGNTMVARLAGEEHMLGVLVTSNPEGAVTGFGEEQLRLLRTLANHVTVTLENGHLEHSVTQLRELEKQLSYKAFHDSLTTLANRALFRSRLQSCLAQRVSHLAVLFIDLDDFKTVNDTLGHDAGDQLLTIVGQRIAQCARHADLAARLGGDEFAILLEGAGPEEAAAVAGRVLATVRDPIVIEGASLSVQASVGVAMAETGITDADELMRDADLAMYTAKRNGKGCYEFFMPDMTTAVMLRHQLKQDLKAASESGQFENYYQTMVDLGTGRITAVETLVRWNHPWAGLVTPDEFIPLAEETGIILSLGRQVMRDACQDAAAWRRLDPDLSVSVNLSARQLADADLVEDVRRSLDEAGLDPRALIVEVTETTAMADLDLSAERLRALKDMGVQVAMDDFGTGYSSLSQINRLPVDIVKIPKPFVDQIGTHGLELVQGIARLSQTLGMEVVAEGIEDQDQYDQLQTLVGARGQGYFFSRPVPACVMTELVSSGGWFPWTGPGGDPQGEEDQIIFSLPAAQDPVRLPS